MDASVYIWALWQTKTGKAIICVLIGYLIIYILGWWLIPILIGLVLLYFLADYYEKRKAKKRIEDENRKIMMEDVKRAKILEARSIEIKHEHPTLVVDTVTNKGITHEYAYWLAIGKKDSVVDEFDNKSFKMRFDISKNLTGMIVTISNTCNHWINVSWTSFKINKKRVHIDGVYYEDFTDSGILEPGQRAIKLLQPHNLYWKSEFDKLFDTEQMQNEKVVYMVEFDVLDHKNVKRTYLFDVYTQSELLKI